MIVEPTVTDLLKIANNRFQLVIMISKRARQISQGALPLVPSENEHPVSIAAKEIAQGKVIKC